MKAVRRGSAVVGVVGISLLLALACGGKTEDRGSGTSGTGNGTSGTGNGSSSGGGGSGTTAVSSGLPSSRALMDLSESEVDELCHASAQAAERAISQEDFCTFFGALSSALFSGGEAEVDREACEAERDACLADDETFEFACSETARSSLAECSATVGEYETCYAATLDRSGQLFGVFSCTDIDLNQIAEFENQSPRECAAFDEQCPGVIGGDPLDGGGGDPLNGGGGDPSPTGCTNTCEDAFDGFCDDGGPGSDFPICSLGTDCADCGPR